MTPYFGEHVYGALDDYRNFSKKMIIEKILGITICTAKPAGLWRWLRRNRGDTPRGGVAVAVASDETNRRGINSWKRERLICWRDIVIGDYRQQEELLSYLMGD